MTPIDENQFVSSNLDTGTYDPETRAMTLTFARTGDTYDYAGVPEQVWEAFKQSLSPGQFFVREIKGRYEA